MRCPTSLRLILLCLILLVSGLASPRAAQAPQVPSAPASADDVRALWVTRTTLTSPESVATLIRAAEDGGFNTLLVQVRGRGDAYYDSAVEPRASALAGQEGFDPLAAVLEEAHAAGISVHAWVAVNLVSSAFTLPASRQHIVYRQPEWLMVPREIATEMWNVDPRSPEYVGRLSRWTRAHTTRVEGLYVSPVHPAAAEYAASVVEDLVTRYAVDGVHLDYVRFPGADFDFSRSALDAFKAAIAPELTAEERAAADTRERLDPFAWVALNPERWNSFRQSRLTALVMRLRTVVRAARPDAVLSAAVVPDADQAMRDRLQDWRTWLDQGLLDVVCPMAYTTSTTVFARQIAAVQALAGDKRVWAGIGAYRMPASGTLAHIAAARRLGAAGVALFSYDAIVAPPNSTHSLATLGREAFGTGAVD